MQEEVCRRTGKSDSQGQVEAKEKSTASKPKNKRLLEASVQTPPKPSPKTAFGTPPKKATKSAAVPTTPSTVSSRSTTESKRAVTLMSGLDLKSPSSKKNKACSAEEASLVDSVDYEDPATIAWQTKEGIASAI